MGGGGGDTTTVQDIPDWAKPYYTSMYQSAFGAGRTSAGQPGYPPAYRQNPAWGGGYQPSYYQQAGQGAPAGQAFRGMGGGRFQGMGGGGQQAFQPQQGQAQIPANIPAGGQNQPGFQQTGGIQTGGFSLPSFQIPTVSKSQGPRGSGNVLIGQQTINPNDYLPGGQYATVPGTAPGGAGSKGGAGMQQGIPGVTDAGTAGGTDAIIGPGFQGPFTAPPSQLEQQAFQGKAQLGQNYQGIEQGLLGTGLAQAGGAFLHPQSNPYLQGAMEAAIRPVTSAYERYAPQARSQAIQSGAYKGSSRRDLLESEMQSQLQQNVGDVARQMAMTNYQGERGLQQNAGTLLDQAIRLGQVSPELMLQAGGGLRGLEQMRLEEQLRQYEESIAAPFRPISSIAQIIRGSPTGSQTTQNYGAGGLGGGIVGALGGAAGGAAVGNAIGSGYGGYGAGLGAVLGGLGGALA